jgi:hypothetical protein
MYPRPLHATTMRIVTASQKHQDLSRLYVQKTDPLIGGFSL